MKIDRSSIDPKLQAYFDSELDTAARSAVEKRLLDDPRARSELDDIANVTELLQHVYGNPPAPRNPVSVPQPHRHRPTAWWGGIAAAVALVALAVSLGVGINWTQAPPAGPMETLVSVAPGDVARRNVLLNTSSSDLNRFEQILDAAERYLGQRATGSGANQVEVLVHGPALQWLERGSPAANRVAQLERRYHNLSFRACGVAMKMKSLTTGVEPTLLPEADSVDAAIEEIVRRVSDGWLYVRG